MLWNSYYRMNQVIPPPPQHTHTHMLTPPPPLGLWHLNQPNIHTHVLCRFQELQLNHGQDQPHPQALQSFKVESWEQGLGTELHNIQCIQLGAYSHSFISLQVRLWRIFLPCPPRRFSSAGSTTTSRRLAPLDESTTSPGTSRTLSATPFSSTKSPLRTQESICHQCRYMYTLVWLRNQYCDIVVAIPRTRNIQTNPSHYVYVFLCAHGSFQLL